MTDYKKSCLVNTKCKWEERQAAIYDYAGAIYGQAGKVKFDPKNNTGQLTSAERAYVEKNFGTLKHQDEIKTFLNGARRFYFEALPIKKDFSCLGEKRPPLNKVENQSLGQAYILSGRHGCYLSYEEQWVKSELELAMAANPKEFAIGLEGWGKVENNYLVSHEYSWILNIAQKLGVSLFNPVPYAASDLKVVQEAAKKSQYDVIDFQVAYVFQLSLNMVRENPEMNQSAIINYAVRTISQHHNTNPQTLADATVKYFDQYPDIEQAALESDKRALLLAEASNSMSKSGNRNRLEIMNHDMPAGKALKTIFIIGKLHTRMIEEIYQ